MATLPAGTVGQILVKGSTDWEAKDVDNVTVEVDASVGLRVKPGSIGNTHVTTITRSGAISGSSLTNLPLTPAAAGQFPSANLVNATRGTGVYDPNIVFASAAAPTSYASLDLSSIMGANKGIAFLMVENNGGGANGDYVFRMNGEAFTIGGTSATSLGAGISAATIQNGEIGYIWVPTSSAGVVQWKCNTALTSIVRFRSFILLKN